MSLLLKGPIEEVPLSDLNYGFSTATSRSEEGRGSVPYFGPASSEFFPLQRKIQDADIKTMHAQIRAGDWFVTVAFSTSRSFHRT